MKNKILSILLLFMCFVIISPVFAIGNAIKCYNGIYIGKKLKNTDVIAFRGIPFAKKPIGNLRWKAPIEAPKSNKIHLAYKYDTLALQTDSDHDYQHFDKSEDCLRLNIWTSDLKRKNKPVMVFFHGGAYGWEGTPLEIYNGQYLTNEYKDIIVVTIDYRVNLMGFIDFSKVKGGENFKDAPFLGILDCLMGLKWVNQNIEAFGGDPNNITIFGESAGGGIVTSLMTIKEAQGMFKRVIAQSGALNLTATRERFDELGQTEAFLKATNAKSMDDLMKLTDKQILEAMTKPTEKTGGEGLSGVAYLNNFPLRGENSPIPENPVLTIQNGMSKDVDLMIGTTADEFRYWILEMATGSLDGNLKNYDAFMANRAQLDDKNIQKKYLSIIKTDEDKYSKQYKNIWKNTELASDIWFRMPSIRVAEAHKKAGGSGKTYMYCFTKRADINDWWGAAHAVELPYMFYNVNYREYGSVDKVLAKKLSNAWVNFARTGNPSTEYATWTQYDLKDRNTMVVGNDGSFKMVKDYKGEQRKLLDKALP